MQCLCIRDDVVNWPFRKKQSVCGRNMAPHDAVVKNFHDQLSKHTMFLRFTTSLVPGRILEESEDDDLFVSSELLSCR